MDTIPIGNEIERFKTHLEYNPRTIFSAKFGDGKSYFLNEFKKIYSGEFLVVTVYPVNYSVASNEDVFEYLKRDILLQLAEKGMVDDIDFKAFSKSLFSKENTIEVIGFLTSMLSGGEILNKFVAKGIELKSEYDKQKTNIDKFQESFSVQRGGIYENDSYSKLITQVVKRIRESKQTILMIEDLDRIDPKHLFRILNILGAHIDSDQETNKFGFNNIVVVMDYDTTKHIFHHFYGDKANYTGYISKFLSHYPFYYSIVNVARAYLCDYFTLQTGLNPEEIEQGPYGDTVSLKSFINTKSVRDIVKIVDDLSTQFEATALEFKNHNIINTNTKIVRLMSLLTRIGFKISVYQLGESILKQGQRGLESLEGFLLFNNEILGGCFRLQNESYAIFKTTDDFLSNINVKRGCIGNDFHGNIKSYVCKAIKEATNFVHDCNLS